MNLFLESEICDACMVLLIDWLLHVLYTQGQGSTIWVMCMKTQNYITFKQNIIKLAE